METILSKKTKLNTFGGIFFYEINTGDFVSMKKMTLIK